MDVLVNSDRVYDEVTSKGTPIRKQQAALVNGEAFPLPFFLTLNQGQLPYPPGDYILDPACMGLTPWGTLDIDAYKVALLPRNKAKAA